MKIYKSFYFEEYSNDLKPSADNRKSESSKNMKLKNISIQDNTQNGRQQFDKTKTLPAQKGLSIKVKINFKQQVKLSIKYILAGPVDIQE